MTGIGGIITAGLGLASAAANNVNKAIDQVIPHGVGVTPAPQNNNPSTTPSNPVRPVNNGPVRSKPFQPLPSNPGQGKSAGSPDYPWLYEYKLPIPQVAQPLFTENVNGIPIQYYETTIEPFQKQVYPNLGPANMIGYGGIAPGATFEIPRGTETVVRYVNRGNLSSAVHLHGSYTHSPWDGWAFDEIEPGQYKDYYYPNTEPARSMWYHDHAHKHTAIDAYYGQSGAYYLTDPEEDARLKLPTGKYQLPLALMDKIYQANGDLASPDQSRINFFGDVIEVNSQPWPYYHVEPRKYLLRVFNMGLSRLWDIYIADENNKAIEFLMVASDSGLFSAPVRSRDFLISNGERYEIVVDFAPFAGQNLTMMNDQRRFPDNTKFQNTDKIMRFCVGRTVSDNTNNGNVPSALANVQFPPNRDTIDHEFNFQMGGADVWTINGVDFSDPNTRVLARPPQGTVERWRIRHTGGPAVHPVHVHLVNLQIISRTGGTRGLEAYETAGLKDIVLIEPGETVDVLATYGPWNGMYMFHCHNLIHEDYLMMAAFNTTRLRALGYDYESTQGFSDPMDERYRARDYDVSAFNDQARRDTVRMFGKLNAYAPARALMNAESAYYRVKGYGGDTLPVVPVKGTAPPSSTIEGVVKRAAATPAVMGEQWRA